MREIYQGSATNIDEPKNLEKIITTIDGLDWFSAREEGLGNLYEGLLEKNANEKKSGAGQYFTPRVLIDVMTRLVKPQPGERCNDPACGTFGFMISASQYVRENTDDFFELDADTARFEREEAFSGCELVHDTHRLALMNAMLHDIEGEIKLADTLSNAGKEMKGYDVVLTNPPFGTKKGGERATRDDFTFPTSNKQLNFLQHIYRSLNTDGKARAAVVLPDNVLFADGDGERIRKDLMEKCNLHTILRLPTGIFYAQGVKTNADYTFLKKQLKKDGNMQWYFVVWYLGATGARVSELIRIKIEHVNLSYFDLYSKGGKLRRLYIPKKLRDETQKWLSEEQRTTGYLFLNRFGERITARGISQQLKNYADKYGLDSKVIYPHSFRHLYAKNFLEKYNDIALLADLMGHESIETTRIYLRRTATEQQSLIDKIVTW